MLWAILGQGTHSLHGSIKDGMDGLCGDADTPVNMGQGIYLTVGFSCLILHIEVVEANEPPIMSNYVLC